jgi:hypothetical protein
MSQLNRIGKPAMNAGKISLIPPSTGIQVLLLQRASDVAWVVVIRFCAGKPLHFVQIVAAIFTKNAL